MDCNSSPAEPLPVWLQSDGNLLRAGRNLSQERRRHSQLHVWPCFPTLAIGVQNNTVIAAAPGQTNSSVTSIYCDYNFPLDNFRFTFRLQRRPRGRHQRWPSAQQHSCARRLECRRPHSVHGSDAGTTARPTPVQVWCRTAAIVAEITGLPNATSITFAAGDALNFNQVGGGTANNIATVAAAAGGAGAQTTACRLNAVSYFLQVPAAGGTVQTPRLMRQVNGLNAVPVADNIINLQFTYDVIDSTTGTVVANQQNPIGAGSLPT